MDPITIMAIIAGISALGQFISQERTNRRNIDESTYNRLWQERMVEKENEYNTPVNMQAREHEAGWYRNAAGGASGELSFPSAQVGSVNNPTLVDPFTAAMTAFLSGSSGFNQSASAGRTKSLVELEKQQLSAQAQDLRANAQLLGLQGYEQLVVNKYADAMNAVALQGKKLDLDLKIWQKNILEQQFKIGERTLHEVLDKELELKDSQIKLNAMNLEEVIAHIKSYEFSNRESASRTAVNEAEKGLLDVQTRTEAEKMDLVHQQSSGQKIENEQAQKALDMYLQTYDDIVKQVAAQTRLSEKEVRWYWVNSLLHGAGSSAVAGTSAGVVSGILKRRAAAAAAAAAVP